MSTPSPPGTKPPSTLPSPARTTGSSSTCGAVVPSRIGLRGSSQMPVGSLGKNGFHARAGADLWLLATSAVGQQFLASRHSSSGAADGRGRPWQQELATVASRHVSLVAFSQQQLTPVASRHVSLFTAAADAGGFLPCQCAFSMHADNGGLHLGSVALGRNCAHPVTSTAHRCPHPRLHLILTSA